MTKAARNYLIGGVFLPAIVSIAIETIFKVAALWVIMSFTIVVAIGFGIYSNRTDREREERFRHRSASINSISLESCAEITDIVVLANLGQPIDEKTGKRKEQCLHTILRKLTSIETVHIIAGQDDKFLRNDRPSTKDRETVDEFIREAGREGVNREVIMLLPAGDFDPSAVAGLTTVLGGIKNGLGRGRRLAVDITGGSKPMTITCYLAALTADLPITYTVTDGKLKFVDLISLNDPDGILEVGTK